MGHHFLTDRAPPHLITSEIGTWPIRTAIATVEAASDDADTYDVFYDRLSPDGQWFYDDDYGYVWQPKVAVSESSWRPYSDGHWVWTVRGWCWVSNEDFGWATYHYGRWVCVAGTGWVWRPGDEWAPAWVSWRQSDDDAYCGWAPPAGSFPKRKLRCLVVV
jgi:hypothetical protein